VVGKKQKRNINDSLLWNMRGMGQIGRIPALVSKIKESHADFVGIMENKKESFSPGLLKSLTGTSPFSWCHLPAKGSAGGILVGANSNKFFMTVGDIRKYYVSVMHLDTKSRYNWKLVVIYGAPYEGKNRSFRMSYIW
jgi:hypothetical protein